MSHAHFCHSETGILKINPGSILFLGFFIFLAGSCNQVFHIVCHIARALYGGDDVRMLESDVVENLSLFFFHILFIKGIKISQVGKFQSDYLVSHGHWMRQWLLQKLHQGTAVRKLSLSSGIEVGRDIAADYLDRANDAVVVAIGTPVARDLKIPGREKKGIHLALEFLGGQNRQIGGEIESLPVCAKGRRVLVIGGGDTGSDCVGTAIRQGAKDVMQIEIMPRPPKTRSQSTPWPAWPYQLRTSSSHLEGCERRWNLNSLEFLGGDSVEGVKVQTVGWSLSPEGRPLKFAPVAGTEEVIPCDLVLLAMGFTGVSPDSAIVRELGLGLTPRNGIVSDPSRNLFAVGDCASGASLVVRALASGKSIPL